MKARILPLVALLVALCLQLTAFSATLPRISDINYDAWDDAQDYAAGAATIGSGMPAGDLTSLEVMPGGEVRIYLDASLFADASGVPVGDSSYGVTLAQLRSASVTVAVRSKSGSEALEDITLEYYKQAASLGLPVQEGTSYIKIKFADHLVSTREVAFDYTVYLRVKGKEREETRIQIAGTVDNDRVSVSPGDDFVSLEEGAVAEADQFVQNIRVDLGNGFSVTTSLNGGSKVYGVAQVKSVEDFYMAALDAFPDVSEVYEIRQIGLQLPGNVYRFDLQDLYHVYNAQGNYLGTTAEMLPWSERYYLATSQLEGFAEALGAQN